MPLPQTPLMFNNSEQFSHIAVGILPKTLMAIDLPCLIVIRYRKFCVIRQMAPALGAYYDFTNIILDRATSKQWMALR